MAFDILRKEKGVEILLALAEGMKGVREIQKAVGGSYKTIYERIAELDKRNLITQELSRGHLYHKRPYDMRLLRLTDKGRELAQSLIDCGFVRPLLLPKIRERWIIATLHTLRAVSGRTRLMKLLFLLKNESGLTKRELSGFYQFKAGKYGPFSRAVIEDLKELQDKGFVKVALPNEFDEDVMAFHELVQEHPDVIQEALGNLPLNAVQKIEKLELFNEMSLMELLEYVYTNYPKYVKKSVIVERALHSGA